MISTRTTDDIAWVVIEREDKRNALDRDHWGKLAEAVKTASKTGAKAVVIRGAGDRVFASGADIAELAQRKPGEALEGVAQGALLAIENSDLPVLAAINGYALGGGCELALAADFRIASTSARIGLPEVRLGIIPGAGGTWRLPRVVGYAKALELIVTGAPVSAEEAYRIGLVNRLAEPEDLDEAAAEFLSSVLAGGATAIRLVRSLLKAHAGTSQEMSALAERAAFGMTLTDPDRQQRMDSFLNKSKERDSA